MQRRNISNQRAEGGEKARFVFASETVAVDQTNPSIREAPMLREGLGLTLFKLS